MRPLILFGILVGAFVLLTSSMRTVNLGAAFESILMVVVDIGLLVVGVAIKNFSSRVNGPMRLKSSCTRIGKETTFDGGREVIISHRVFERLNELSHVNTASAN